MRYDFLQKFHIFQFPAFLQLIHKTAAVFRQDYFPHYAKAREEIEKRVKALQMLKKYQQEQVLRLVGEKHELTEKAEELAEKYEDIKDKQDALMKRCERLLLTVSQKKAELSHAENDYVRELKEAQEKVGRYAKAIEKVRRKQKYQEIHVSGRCVGKIRGYKFFFFRCKIGSNNRMTKSKPWIRFRRIQSKLTCKICEFFAAYIVNNTDGFCFSGLIK